MLKFPFGELPPESTKNRLSRTFEEVRGRAFTSLSTVYRGRFYRLSRTVDKYLKPSTGNGFKGAAEKIACTLCKMSYEVRTVYRGRFAVYRGRLNELSTGKKPLPSIADGFTVYRGRFQPSIADASYRLSRTQTARKALSGAGSKKRNNARGF
ncbi:hypothetical protein JFK97_19070 [Chromobacterium phragmitis]|uniref:hypothetical protein n=1 Tax=Chromobacterium amazonense TaxID=1382803 RepID=UPI0021B829AE|nr:hypothetical protein [Chromobacterium amazonense]MBM2886495.1 hypothetical protein [Chromobacterium amazonense]